MNLSGGNGVTDLLALGDRIRDELDTDDGTQLLPALYVVRIVSKMSLECSHAIDVVVFDFLP